VAEGVESAEVAAALRVMGCKAAQGWHFSKPLNAASATAWLVEHGVAAVQQAPLPTGTGTGGPRAPSPASPYTGLPGPRPPAPPPGLPGPRQPTPPAGLPSLWWQAVKDFGPPLRGR
jgi:hypothetical protein